MPLTWMQSCVKYCDQVGAESLTGRLDGRRVRFVIHMVVGRMLAPGDTGVPYNVGL